MATLNEQLGTLYESKWAALKEKLATGRFDVQPPFLLGLALEKEVGKGYTYDEWYANADLRVMIFGKEPHVWGWPTGEDGKTIPMEKLLTDDFVESYERFYSDNYLEDEIGGTCFLTDSEYKLNKSPFFRIGFNGIMSGIHEILKDEYPGKRVAYLWNNITKFSTNSGDSINSPTYQLEKDYFHVIPKEIELLKPDIVLFFTGFAEKKYDNYIRDNFTVEKEPTLLGNQSAQDVVKLHLAEVPLSYKTHHPGVTKAHGQKMGDEIKWKHYNAILADIKENLNSILFR